MAQEWLECQEDLYIGEDLKAILVAIQQEIWDRDVRFNCSIYFQR